MNIRIIIFILFMFLDFIIKRFYFNKPIYKSYLRFINLDYITMVFIIFITVYSILTLFTFLDVLFLPYHDNFVFAAMQENRLHHFMSDTSSSGTTTSTESTTSSNPSSAQVNADATININHPRFNISVPAYSINNLAAAASVTGGAGVAIKVIQRIPGLPAVKIAAGAATMAVTQALTIGLGKVLNSNSRYAQNNNNQNFIQFFDCSFVGGLNAQAINPQFNDFPLNLLPEINQLATAELMFLFIILNIYIVKYISNIDYSKYIPKNKVGIIITKILNRYIMLYSKSVTFFLALSWIGLFICVLGSKVFLYYVLNYT